MTHNCNNCGRYSHCGENVTMLTEYINADGTNKELIVCHHCSCKKCNKSVDFLRD